MTNTTQRFDTVPYNATLMTAEDLMANPVPNMCTELVRGHILVREPPGCRHGAAAAQLLIAIGAHAKSH